jgi:hypothetical protein
LGLSGKAVGDVPQLLDAFQRHPGRFEPIRQVLPPGIDGDAVIGHQHIHGYVSLDLQIVATP